MPDAAPFRSGFVSIVGRPNAGKSTLLNALVGGKLAIVSEKPQTTRSSVEGVVNLEGAQIIFLDTPGIHASTSLLNKRMMDAVRSALEDRDLVLYLGDATAAFNDEDVKALSAIRNLSKPAFLLLTKIDKLSDKRMLLPRIEEYKAVREFDEYFPISSVKRTGLDQLRDAIVKRLPESSAYFPPEYLTDQPERFLGAELIRERILRETRQEVPHSVAVVIDEWKDTPKLLRIMATIYVERPGQKAIEWGTSCRVSRRILSRIN